MPEVLNGKMELAEESRVLHPCGWPKDWRKDLWFGGMSQPNVAEDIPAQIASWRSEADQLWPLDKPMVRGDAWWARAHGLRVVAAQIEVLWERRDG